MSWDKFNALLTGLSETSKFNQIDTTCSKLKALLSNLITCPNCKFKFDPKGSESEEEIQKKFNLKQKSKSDKEKVLSEIKGDIKELEKLKKELIKEVNSIKLKIKDIKNSLIKILQKY